MLKTNRTDTYQGFKKIIASHTDEELVSVLKRRSQYRKEAVDFAISEAIRRGIIFSEQDLFDEKFSEEKHGFSWLPVPHTKDARGRVKKSILRSLFISGLIPLVYGAFQMYRGVDFPSEAAIAFGFIWILLVILLYREPKNWIFVVLGGLDITGGAFIIYRLISINPSFFDFFAVIVLVLMVLYSLAFYNRLTGIDQKQ